MAATTGFLNDNLFRAYPLLSRPAIVRRESDDTELELPLATFVDFGCTLGPDTGYAPADDVVYLAEISRAGNVFTFRIRCTATDAVEYVLVFTRELTDPEFALEDAVTDVENTLDCNNGGFFEGFLVTGRLQELATILPDGDTLIGGEDLQFSPTLVLACDGRMVRSINLVNFSRTHTTAPDTCDEAIIPAAIYVEAMCLAGPLQLQAGYNCQILFDVNANSISVGAAVGAGEGEPCEEVPVTAGEEKPPDSPFYSGGPPCYAVIKTINGATGPHITLRGGPGISIGPDPLYPHTILMSFDFNGLKFLP